MAPEKEPHAVSESNMVSPYAYLARMLGDASDEMGSICGIVEIECGAVKERKDDLKHPSSSFILRRTK